MNVHQPIPQAVEENDFFLMANLLPRNTGLPMVVWIGHRGQARHDARVKVCRTPGDRMDIDDLAVVCIRPSPELTEGPLDSASLKAVQAWIRLNEAALLAYWDGEIDTADLLEALKKV